MRSPPEVLRTPVERLRFVSEALNTEVWIKRDDMTHPHHGGNKVRKLRLLLTEALRKEATDIVTVGAAGSNHVLSAAIHSAPLGLSVTALVLPHPYSRFAHHKVAATLSAGAQLIPVTHPLGLPGRVRAVYAGLRRQGRRPFIVPAGGTGRAGTRAYAGAAAELLDQVACGEMPAGPAGVFVALGSGGTAAGLWNGFSNADAPLRLCAVRVVSHRFIGRAFLRWLADRAGPRPRRRSALVVVTSELGQGYGRPSEAGREAADLFSRDGIALDLTYTAKAAAALVREARTSSGRGPLLLWHTLSSTHPFRVQDEPPVLPPDLAGLWQ